VAAEVPLGGDEDIDESALLGGGGSETLVVFGGEGFEGFLIFAGQTLRFSVDAVFEGIETGSSLALGGARGSGFWSIAAVGRDLAQRGQGDLFSTGR